MWDCVETLWVVFMSNSLYITHLIIYSCDFPRNLREPHLAILKLSSRTSTFSQSVTGINIVILSTWLLIVKNSLNELQVDAKVTSVCINCCIILWLSYKQSHNGIALGRFFCQYDLFILASNVHFEWGTVHDIKSSDMQTNNSGFKH